MAALVAALVFHLSILSEVCHSCHQLEGPASLKSSCHGESWKTLSRDEPISCLTLSQRVAASSVGSSLSPGMQNISDFFRVSMTPSRPARSARLCLQPWPPFQSHMRPPHGQSMRNHLVYVNVVNVRTMICNYGCTIKLRQPPMSEFFYDVLPIGRIFTHSQRYDSNLWFEKKPMEEMFWSHLLKVAWVWSLFWMICLNKLEAQNCTSMILMNLCVVVAPHQWHTWNSLNQYFKFDAGLSSEVFNAGLSSQSTETPKRAYVIKKKFS